MNNADYQLRHATLGRHGSFWGYQTNNATRDMLRELTRTAALPSRLQHIDAVAAYALGSTRTLKEDLVIGFQDGEFAIVGPDMLAFTYTPTIGQRDNDAPVLTVPTPHKLSSMTQAQVDALSTDVPELSAVGTWFLIPKPSNINPIVLSTKLPGVNLSYGVDFFTSKNFIITQLPPSEYFETGAIIISVAEVYLESFEAYVSDSPRWKKSRKWVNTCARRAQSPELFRRAAAEFCGLYVLPDDDVLLNTALLPDGTYIYAFANAGVIHIDYVHTPITVGASYPAGFVVCDLFEMRNVRSHGSQFLASSFAPLDLSGLFGLPLQLPSDGIVEFSYQYVSAYPKTHLRLYFPGALVDLEVVWAIQLAQEQRTGVFLSDILGVSNPTTFPSGGSFPPSVNMGEKLTTFYGERLFMLAVSGLPARFRFELLRFLNEHSPVGNVVLLSDSDAPVLAALPAALPPGVDTTAPAVTLTFNTNPLP